MWPCVESSVTSQLMPCGRERENLGQNEKLVTFGAGSHVSVGCSFEAKIKKRCKPPLCEVSPHASSGEEGSREGSRPLSTPEGQTRGWHANHTRASEMEGRGNAQCNKDGDVRFIAVWQHTEEAQDTSEGGRRRKSHGLPDTPLEGGWCNTNRSWHPSAIRSGCG